MSETGQISLALAFILSLYAMFSFLFGARTRRRDFIESGARALYVILFLLIVASASLVYSLLTLDFSLKYVASNTSSDLSPVYRFTAFWAGQSGSLLLWTLILGFYSAAIVWFNRRTRSELLPYVALTLAAISSFFLFLITFVESPFEKLPFTPEDGRGLNPILHNFYMAIHPVSLYIGYVGLSVPFAFGIGALLSGKLGDEWITSSRKWSIFAWIFLSLGLLLGARWAYLELGWGGYWAWDPVENAAFMPWLTSTAFLHSVMIQERKGMLKKWNMSLVIITFFLALFGTFITRSGIISSVHSFAQSDIGPYFLSFIAFVLVFSFAAFVARMGGLRTENRFESMLSRESAFLFNNLLFLGAAFAVFIGTIFPILTEAVINEKILVGPPYFNRVNVPIGLVLIFLMGVGPIISWRKASKENLKKNFLLPLLACLATIATLFILGIKSIYPLISFGLCAFVVVTVVVEFSRGVRVRTNRGENPTLALWRLFSRNRRRYGGYVIHLGVVLIVIGITASSAFVTRKEVILDKGQSAQIGDYTLRYEDLRSFNSNIKHSTVATLTISKDGKELGLLKPESNVFKYSGNRPIDKETEVALRSTLKDDLYVVLTHFEPSGRASFTLFINPMVTWIWIGGVVLVLGAVITLLPSGIKVRQESFARYHVETAAEGTSRP